ncbi:hypothetical protein C8J55DRAFT_510946 [Lentinula edodes]|uniref:Uncharacterized protein n=1 Tax=Lentinula lateritia TaxID=40482 RepID=A0A9W9AHG0_9AGAR|nr:hypothetical protein C8J55DRAFT_510946 [Lentinula edodes]
MFPWEDEENLAAADGMNHFTACVVLCQIPLDELLEISPEKRIARFAPHLGQDGQCFCTLSELYIVYTSN